MGDGTVMHMSVRSRGMWMSVRERAADESKVCGREYRLG